MQGGRNGRQPPQLRYCGLVAGSIRGSRATEANVGVPEILKSSAGVGIRQFRERKIDIEVIWIRPVSRYI
jgi:hypothetical protein